MPNKVQFSGKRVDSSETKVPEKVKYATAISRERRGDADWNRGTPHGSGLGPSSQSRRAYSSRPSLEGRSLKDDIGSGNKIYSYAHLQMR